MNNQDIKILTDILNALSYIPTQGKNTVIMGKCLEALEGFILDKQEEIRLENNKEE